MTDLPSPDLNAILCAAGEAGYEWDLQNDVIRWFGAYGKIFGTNIPPPENSEDFSGCIHPDDRYIVFSAGDEIIDREFRMRLVGGNVIRVHERGTAEIQDHHPVKQRGIIRIIERQVNVAAHHELYGSDPLTGRFNRNNMLAQLNKVLDAVRGAKRRGAYMVIGIDKMSFVNEAIGMEAGDGLLRGVADRLAELMPARAILGRVGGDMFGILLPEQTERDFQPLADKILQNFRDYPVQCMNAPLHITVSIGGVRLATIMHGAADAMIRAEQALHDARQRGRDLFVEYQESSSRADANRKTLEIGERIKRAFRNNGLKLAFQAVIDSESNKPVFYEALVRMFKEDGQMIAAADFVPVIEQLGLAFELDRHVLSLAVAELETYPDLSLAINISGLTAAQVNWPNHMRSVLGHRPHVAKRLIVEITETAAIVDVSETKRFVDSFRELGGQVALDDFGAGFTSIRHLRTLALSIMKIDRELLTDLMANAEQQHLVRMMMSIARGLGLKTVAEGVETEDVAAWLRKEKVEMMQGYYFGKPTIDRPWLALKGSETPPAKSAVPLTTRTSDAKPSTEIRVASFI